MAAFIQAITAHQQSPAAADQRSVVWLRQKRQQSWKAPYFSVRWR
jgi:hypothetical protein